MKKILAIAAALSFCACSSIKYSRTSPDGTTVTASGNSFLQSRKNVKATDSNGTSFSEDSVTGDVQMVNALDSLVQHTAATFAKFAAAAPTNTPTPIVVTNAPAK